VLFPAFGFPTTAIQRFGESWLIGKTGKLPRALGGSGLSVHVFDQDLLGQAGTQGDSGTTNPANQISPAANFGDQSIFTKTHLAQPLASAWRTSEMTHPNFVP
jgi:hypothetical protein